MRWNPSSTLSAGAGLPARAVSRRGAAAAARAAWLAEAVLPAIAAAPARAVVRVGVVLLAGAVLPAGCLFSDRPCEPGRYECPSSELEPADLGGPRLCTLEAPCALPPAQVQAIAGTPAEVATNLAAISGRPGQSEAWLVGQSGADRGVLLRATLGQPARAVATLPLPGPPALALTPAEPPTLIISSQGSALSEYGVESGQVTPLPLDTGGCQGRISPTAALRGVLALEPADLWLVGAPTSDAAAGLFRVRRGVCQVLPEPAAAGLPFNGVWGTLRSPTEPAPRLVWAVGDRGAAVVWTFQGADGPPLAQHFAIAGGAAVRAVSGSSRCPTAAGADGRGACVFMITADALYGATDSVPTPVALPAVLRAAELTGLFVDGDALWLCGTRAAAGLVARLELRSAAWSYLGGLPPRGGALRAVWAAGDGSAWLAGDRGTILYLPKGP